MHAFRDGMMGPCIRRGVLYFVVPWLIKDFFYRARAKVNTIARAKVRFSRERLDDFFFVGNPENGVLKMLSQDK